MKAAVYYAPNDLRITEIEMPRPKDNEVLLRVKACGVCGTDVHIFCGDGGCFPTPAGTVLGHEFAGEVVEVGKAVFSVKVGDRVCVDPNQLCGECSFCLEGLGHFCEKMRGIGTGVHGGFAQYCAVPQSQVHRIGDNTSFEAAAMAEPVACCLHGIDLCNISCGDTVAVIGGGMIGLILLQLARLSGAGKLILIEPVAEKRELGLRLGADLVIDPFTEDVEKRLEEEKVGRIACVIECVGKIGTLRQAIAIAGQKATVMMFGLTAPEDELPIRPFELFKKELTLKTSYINPYTQKRALRLIDSGKIDVSSMIFRREPLEALPQVLSDATLRSQGKFLILP